MGNLYLGIIAMGLGLIALAVGLGIGMIGFGAVSAISRQPSAAGKVQTAALIFMALIEGVSLFALVMVYMLINK